MMNDKEVGELRRRIKLEKNNITHIHGCYVNENGEAISVFKQPMSLIQQADAESYLALLRRTLSGVLGKNLLDVAFSTQQVMEGEEHKLLMELKNSALKDDAVVQAFFERVMKTQVLEGNYLILLAYDSYDVPYRTGNDEILDDGSSDVFAHLLCAICSVKMTKPALSYCVDENEFHNSQTGWVVSAPELGFLFPAFDDRRANIHNALCYTRDIGDNHDTFMDAIFNTHPPMPAAVQEETFRSILHETLAEECSFEVVQAVHEHLSEKIDTHKANKVLEPLVINKFDVQEALHNCGVSDERMTSFKEKYEQEFGADANITPHNLVNPKKFEVRTPDVVIQVNPDRSDLIEIRDINGTKYIMICANEGVEVNGVNVHIAQEESTDEAPF